jgi:tetratricopeptide (TPR) repeat protein
MPQGFTAIPDWFSWENQGAGIAVVDLDGNGQIDLIVFVVDDPVKLARDLFSRETQSDYDTFRDAATEYADVLGEEGLAEYRRLAEEAWQELPARIGPRRGQDDRYDDSQVASILDFFAERDGDVDLRIALRAKNLSSQWAYLQLAEFCLTCGREEEALRRAEEGLWLFEDDRPDERLVSFAVDLLQKEDRKADAEAHLWRAFEKAPSLHLYGRLRALGGRVGGGGPEDGAACADGGCAGDPPKAARPGWRAPALRLPPARHPAGSPGSRVEGVAAGRAGP